MPEGGFRQPAGRMFSVLGRSEARAALAGMLVALVLLTLLAIRLHPSGPSLPGRSSPVSSQSRSTFWIVAPGQTLGAISAASGLPLKRIEALNPGLDAGKLTIGRTLRLRPSRRRTPT